MAKPKIIIKTLDNITGAGISDLLKMELGEGLDITMARSFEELKSRTVKEKFSMLIIELKTIKGIAVRQTLQELISNSRSAKILVICNELDIDFCRWLYRMGVLGVVPTHIKLKEMQSALAYVCKGERYIAREILLQLMQLPVEN